MIGDVFFVHASITLCFEVLHYNYHLYLFSPVCPSILQTWMESYSSSDWQHLAKYLVTKTTVCWMIEYMNECLYDFTVISVTLMGTRKSFIGQQRTSINSFFFKTFSFVSLMENRLLFHTWQMSHTSAVMKFSFCQFSVSDGRIRVKTFYFIPFRLLSWSFGWCPSTHN